MSRKALAGQVLEFTLGDERYCVEIDHVSEILNNDRPIRRLPNADRHVAGITNLRGETAQIVNPRPLLDVPDDGDPNNVIVFETDDETGDSHFGWLVDDVHEVSSVAADDVDTSVEQDHVKGVIKREDLVVWLDPLEMTA